MMTATAISRHTQCGVTLLENMVALLVISVGLLGFAGMQAFTLHGGANATYRQIAMQQVHEMADRIRANPAAYYTVDVKGNYPNEYHGVIANALPSAPPTNCRTDSCTAADLAAFDIYEWQTANNTLLPGDHSAAGGYIVGVNLTEPLPSGAPILLSGTGSPPRQRFAIAVRWDADNTGSKDVGAPTNCETVTATALRCYAVTIDL